MSTQGRYRKILVPLDGSGWARRAISHAVDIARSHPEGELILLTAFEPPAREFADQLALAGQDGQSQLARDQIKQYLSGLRAELRSEDINVTVHISEGSNIPDLICDYVEREGVDLVVMSTHGRSGIAQRLFGSVSRQVVERLDVPVLLIRSDKES